MALLRDSAQSAFLCTRALVGGQAEPGGEVTARGKAMDVANDGAQRRTRQRTDAGNLAQLLDAQIGASQRIQLMLDGEDLLLEDCDLLKHLSESFAQGGGDIGVGIAQRNSDLGFGDIHTERDSEAKLTQ